MLTVQHFIIVLEYGIGNIKEMIRKNARRLLRDVMLVYVRKERKKLTSI